MSHKSFYPGKNLSETSGDEGEKREREREKATGKTRGTVAVLWPPIKVIRWVRDRRGTRKICHTSNDL